MMLPWFESVYAQFIRRLQSKTLHHALLLCGPAGLGKAELADDLAKTLLCKQLTPQGSCGQCQSCQLFAAGNHPDFHPLMSEKQIGVDTIRGGIAKLSGTAQLGHNKVLVIHHADSMTEAASNALLKTLEEPTTNTYLLLLTSKLNALLPTILSRSEKHVLRLPSEGETLSWLAAQGHNNVTPAMLKAYGNAPFLVKASLEDDSTGLSFSDFQDGIARLMSGADSSVQLAAKWQDSGKQVVSWLQAAAHEKFVQSHLPADYDAYCYCQQALKHFEHPGVNKTVILTGVLDVFAVNSF